MCPGQLLQATRKAYSDGNERIRYTTPAIVTASIRLARKLKSREHFDDNWQSQSSVLYRFMHQCVNNLYQRVNPGCADLALRLFVMCGEIADQTGFEEVSYEFFAQAFTIYEDSISDSRAQFQAVCVVAGALQGTRGFCKENYDTLITKTALHSRIVVGTVKRIKVTIALLKRACRGRQSEKTKWHFLLGRNVKFDHARGASW